jgi:hypothetical protein
LRKDLPEFFLGLSDNRSFLIYHQAAAARSALVEGQDIMFCHGNSLLKGKIREIEIRYALSLAAGKGRRVYQGEKESVIKVKRLQLSNRFTFYASLWMVL